MIKRLYIELTGGYNKTFKIFERKNKLGCKFYFGSSWWGLNGTTVQWMLNYLEENPQFYDFYVHCCNPDESFFQTLLMLSPYANLNTDYLTYLIFLPDANSPEYITDDDIERAFESKYYFMRKVDLKRIDTSKLHF